MRRRVFMWLASMTWGCGSEAEPSAWDVPMRALACGFEPRACLSGVAEAPSESELVPPSVGFSRNVLAEQYVGSVGPGCEQGFVYELPPSKLTGTALMVQSSWRHLDGHEHGLARCADYAATMLVYTPDATEVSGHRLVDHRTFSARADAQSMLCDQVIDSAGPGEPEMPRNVHIWLTPELYPEGLRVVIAALDACAPLDLHFGVSQGYSSLEAGEPTPPPEPSAPSEPVEPSAPADSRVPPADAR